jgi:hypothetical protein
MDDNSLFENALVSVPRIKNITIQPWKGWKYQIKISNNGSRFIDVSNPSWWVKYNKLKHDRMSIDPDTNRPYYKAANQMNLLMSLAALCILDYYVVILLVKNESKEEQKSLVEQYTYKSYLYDSLLVGCKPNFQGQ